MASEPDLERKIQDLERQLQKLGTERFEEVKRRIEGIAALFHDAAEVDFPHLW